MDEDSAASFPAVYMALLLEQDNPFSDLYFDNIAALDYPKSRITVFVYYKVTTTTSARRVFVYYKVTTTTTTLTTTLHVFVYYKVTTTTTLTTALHVFVYYKVTTTTTLTTTLDVFIYHSRRCEQVMNFSYKTFWNPMRGGGEYLNKYLYPIPTYV